MWLVFVVVLASLSCVSADGCAFPPAPATLSWAARSDLAAALATANESFASAVNVVDGGFHVSLMWNGTLLIDSGFGTARSSALGNPPTANDIFRLGSVTKVFTALLSLFCSALGIVSEDSAVSDLDPRLLPGTGITLRQLGTHLAGIQREVPLPCRGDSSACNYTTATMAPFVNALPPIFPTDTRPSYSNLGFAILGRALETALGVPYESAISALATSMSMSSDAGFALTDASRYAYGMGPTLPTSLGWANPNGGMFATPRDMQTFLRFLQFGNESVLPSALLRRWWLPSFALPDGVGAYGMPWEMEYMAGAPAWVLTKLGDVQQFSCMILHVPTLQLSMVLLSNVPGTFAQDVATGAFETVIGALVAGVDVSVPQPPQPPNPAMFLGDYTGYVDAIGANLSVSVLAGMQMNVQVLQNSIPTQLTWLSGNTFALSLAAGLPLPCLFVTQLAWDGENVVIANNTLQFPGMLPGSILYRQSGK